MKNHTFTSCKLIGYWVIQLDMKGLLKEITGLGITVAEFSRRSNVSFVTLQRVDTQKPVRADVLARVERTLTGLKAELRPSAETSASAK